MEELGLAVMQLEADDEARDEAESQEDKWAEQPGFHRHTIC